jgi:1-acyl-sn-glycerol-3-phosphate acyltransferase
MMARVFGWLLLGFVRLLTGAQARWLGCPPKAEQRIYFANHQSHADLVMIWAALPQELRGITRPIAAKDYWTQSPLRAWITREVFNAVYVDRARTDDADPLEPLIQALAQGDSIILFPEGTRATPTNPKPSRPGCTTWRDSFPTWCWCPPGSTTCNGSCPKARWCRSPFCVRSRSARPLRCSLMKTAVHS